MAYDAPIHDMAFTLQAVAGLPKLEGLPGFEAYDADLIAPILEEAGKLARDVLAPLNQPGDAAGAQLTEDGVKAAPGFAEAYAQFRDGGWMGLSAPQRDDPLVGRVLEDFSYSTPTTPRRGTGDDPPPVT